MKETHQEIWIVLFSVWRSLKEWCIQHPFSSEQNLIVAKLWKVQLPELFFDSKKQGLACVLELRKHSNNI